VASTNLENRRWTQKNRDHYRTERHLKAKQCSSIKTPWVYCTM